MVGLTFLYAQGGEGSLKTGKVFLATQLRLATQSAFGR